MIQREPPYKNLLDFAWLNLQTYFCQEVLKPLGSCTRVFTLYGAKNIAINSA